MAKAEKLLAHRMQPGGLYDPANMPLLHHVNQALRAHTLFRLDEYFTPEEIVGKQVTLLANLAPRNIKGIESKGMILLAENSDKKLVFVTPENMVNNGAKVS